MGLPSGKLGQPVFDPTPTRNAGMEFGGNPFTMPNQRQAVPFPQAGILQGMTPSPESLPQFTPQESEALKNRFMEQQFPKGLPWGNQGSGNMGGLF